MTFQITITEFIYNNKDFKAIQVKFELNEYFKVNF